MAETIVKPLDVLSLSNERELICGFPAADYWESVIPRNDMYIHDEESIPVFYRSVFENGQHVEKPAHEALLISSEFTMYLICLRDKPPEGCDKDSFYLSFLKKVCSDTDAAYRGTVESELDDPLFLATLTDDEIKSLSGMDEVDFAEECGFYGVRF